MLPRWGGSGALTNISGEQGPKHRQRRHRGTKKSHPGGRTDGEKTAHKATDVSPFPSSPLPGVSSRLSL